MKSNLCPLLLGVVLAFAGCGRGAGSAGSDWADARRNLPDNIIESLKRPARAGGGAQSNEDLSVGDIVSLDRRGWRYVWQVGSEDGTNKVLKQLDAGKLP